MRDREARTAIERDLRTNFLVEASAGTGKTHSLASRMVRGIAEGAYEVHTMAAVTFTRKAAAELAGRIREGLERLGAHAALERLPLMPIGTVHSFCARILRQFPVEAGVSPGFREIDEAEDRRMRQQLLREAWERPSGRSVLRELKGLGVEPRDLWSGLDCVVENGDLEYPAPDAPPPDAEAAWHEVERFVAYLMAAVPSTAEGDPTCKLIRASRETIAKVRQRRHRDLLDLLSVWERKPVPVKRYWGKGREQQNQALEPVLSAVDRFVDETAAGFLTSHRAAVYAHCLPLLNEVRSRCREERRKLGLLSFNDLQTRCAALLRDCPAAREQLRSRVRHLFVDEVQDSDPVQAEIYFLLAGDGPQAWTEVVPREASLFLVGDPKQSIYRFRRADIEVYNTMRERLLATGGRVISLERSFRSSPELCAWINRAFSPLLPAEASAHQARFAPLSAQASAAEGPSVFRLVSRQQRYQDVTPEEAERIAAWTSSLVREHRTHRWGDFLILTARKAEGRFYQQALGRRQIPCEGLSEEGALGPRAASFLTLLRHLADPQDNANLVGALRGPLFGHSDEELFLHVETHGSLRPYSLPTAPAAGSVAETLRLLDDWRVVVRWMPLGAAALWLLEETGLAALAVDEGPRSLAELRGLVSSLRTCGEAGLTLSQAVAEIIEGGAVELPASSCGQSDVVRVMNVHRSKGLEARVVFLAGPTAGFSLSVEHAVDRRGQGWSSLRCFRRPFAQPAHWSEVEAQELEYLRAEHRRLLYVAATRARETLVVGTADGRDSSPWSELSHALGGCPELSDLPEVSGERAGLVEEPRPPLDRHLPSWTRAAAAFKQPGPHLKPTLPPDGVKVDAQEWGRLVHRLLEQMVREPSLDVAALYRLGRWYCHELPGLIEVLPAALEAVAAVKRTALWGWVRESGERLVEVPFGVREGRRLLFGTIDLALRREDSWGLVDYKTDRQRLDALVASYARQIEHYARSWSYVLEEKVSYAGLLAVREGALSGNLAR